MLALMFVIDDIFIIEAINLFACTLQLWVNCC